MISAASGNASEDGSSRGRTIVSNALVLLVGQPVTWSLTFLYLVVVPRTVGPTAWGELTLALAIGAAAAVVIDFGLVNLLIKEVGRDRLRAVDQVSAALTLRMTLALIAFVVVISVTALAHYSLHLQLVVVAIALASLGGAVATPAVAALQGLERMIFSTVGTFITTSLGVLSGIVVVRAFSGGAVGIALTSLAAAAVGTGLQLYFVQRLMPVKWRFDLRSMKGLVVRGFPFYMTMLSFTIYAWADAILLSLFAPPSVVGWYGASTRLIAATGFVPMAVTTAVFPALSLAHVQDRSGMARLAGKALSFVISLGLPFSIGLAAVGPAVIHLLYGPAFDPAMPVLVILSLTLLPVFVATLASSVVFAADRQARWTVLMSACCVVNIALNLAAIPYFQMTKGNGAIGAAVALLATDSMVGVAALALLPRNVLRALALHARKLALNVVATAAMVALVWPLRTSFVLLPILAGITVYGALALALAVYDRSEVQLVAQLVRDAVRRVLRIAVWRRTAAEPTTS